MDVTGPRYTTTTADLGPAPGLPQSITQSATGLPNPYVAQQSNDFQALTPETKAILSTIVDLLTGKFSNTFALDYKDDAGNKDSIQQTTPLPSIFEFESGEASTEISATAFGPDAEMHIATKGGDDILEVTANNLRIVTGDGSDTVKADAMYLAAALGGAGDDVMYLSGVTLGDILAGEGNDNVDAWGNLVGTVDGEAGDDLLTVGGRQIWFVKGGDGNDVVSVEAVANEGNVGGSVADVGGGNGDDTILVSGGVIGSVHGDDGNDVIDVTAKLADASQVDNVDGGAGDDQITVTAMQVNSVTGGEGDDAITVQSLPDIENYAVTPVAIRAGAGNDTVSVDRTADVYFGIGDGQDTMTLPAGGRIILSDGIELDPSMSVYRSGNLLQITWGNGDALILEIGTEDQMSVTMKDNVIEIAPIMTAAVDETA